MADIDEAQGKDEPGVGHNAPKEVVWDRWQKKRTFVRAIHRVRTHCPRRPLATLPTLPRRCIADRLFRSGRGKA